MYSRKYESLYAVGVAARKLKQMSVSAARADLSGRVAAAKDGSEDTVVTVTGEPAAVLVGIGEYRELRAAAGRPTDL